MKKVAASLFLAFLILMIPLAAISSTMVTATALSTTVTAIAPQSAVLETIWCLNTNAAVTYVQVFDTTGTVTLGTTVPNWTMGIPSSAVAPQSDMDLHFTKGIKVAATTTATGNTAPTTAIVCNFAIK